MIKLAAKQIRLITVGGLALPPTKNAQSTIAILAIGERTTNRTIAIACIPQTDASSSDKLKVTRAYTKIVLSFTQKCCLKLQGFQLEKHIFEVDQIMNWSY